MEKVVHVDSVETVETRSGKTRYVLRDSDGEEFTTFRPRIGQALMALEERMDELKEEFGLRDEDLNLNLGPLGDLL